MLSAAHAVQRYVIRATTQGVRALAFVSLVTATFLLSDTVRPAMAAEAAAKDAGEEKAEGQKAFDFDIKYVADVLHNARGGIKSGTGYLDDLRLQATVDTEKAFGWRGGKFYIFGRRINSGDFNTKYTGEYQLISNIDASPQTRLYEAWYDQSLMDDRLSIRTGLYDFNTEFDADPPAALFLNSSHGIGAEIGQTGQNGPSIFPVTSLAVRVAWQDPSGWVVRAAALDGVPGDPAHPGRNTIKFAKGDGALLAVETGYAWANGQANVGGWGYTARFDDLVAKTSAGTPVRRNDNRGAYAFVESKLLASPDGEFSVTGFLRAGFAESSINPVGLFVGAGLVATGLIPGRAEDQLGFAIAHAKAGTPFRTGVILPTGAPAGHETDYEFTYRATITPWLTLQPDAQYIVHPGLARTVKDVFVFGLRFELSPLALIRK